MQNLLAQAQRLRGHFHQFIVGDELDRLFKIKRLVRHEAEGVIGAGSTHIGQLLFADHVYVEVVVARVLADDEFVEVTAKSLRLRKKVLAANKRPKGWEKTKQPASV